MALCLCMGLVPFSVFPGAVQEVSAQLQSEDIPSYTGSPYTQINDNVPVFRWMITRQRRLRRTVIWMNLADVELPMPMYARN